MLSIKSHLKNLYATDILVILFGTFLSLINILYCKDIETWGRHLLVNFTVIVFIFVLAYLDKNKPSVLSKQLHYWYLVIVIFLAFKEIYFMVDPIRGIVYDDILIKIDRFIFGTDPTHLLYSIANPILTEILQIVYGTFFFLPVVLGIDLLMSNRDEEFHYEAFIIIFGFFLSYVGYFIVPAIGPRFTLHDFSHNNLEMPGIFLTNYLREIVNSGESIPSGTLHPAMMVQRDAFPSGHTQITLLVMYLSIKFKTVSRYALIPIGSLLIFSTVYLRYHYVIDLIAGSLFMVFTLWSGNSIFNWWRRFRGEKVFKF